VTSTLAIRSTFQWYEDGFARRDENPFAPLVLGKEFCSREDLFAPRPHGSAVCDKEATGRRFQAIHREVVRGNLASYSRSGKATGGVQERGDHSSMKMAGVLSKIVAPFHDDFGGPNTGRDNFADQLLQSGGGIGRDWILKGRVLNAASVMLRREW
jgi:hypothetical protein